MKHITQTLGWAALVGILGEVLVYGVMLGWTVTKTVYKDHLYLVAKCSRLRHNLASKELDDKASFAPLQSAMAKQIADLSSRCAKSEGVSETLDKQTRSQQDSINNCQNKALELLAPTVQEITIITWEDKITDNVDHKETFLLITNKVVTPVRIQGRCDVLLRTVSASPAGTESYIGGASLQRKNDFEIDFNSPAWSPKLPIKFNIEYTSSKSAYCDFVVR